MRKAPAYDGTQNCLKPDPAAAAAFSGRIGALSSAAKLLCSSCPFLEPCQTYALSEDVHGVWGGLTDNERRNRRAALGMAEPLSVGDELDLLVLGWRRGSRAIARTTHRPRAAVA